MMNNFSQHAYTLKQLCRFKIGECYLFKLLILRIVTIIKELHRKGFG